MNWEDVRRAFPKQWVLIEADKAYTDQNSVRILDEITPLEKFTDSPDAMKAYQKIHRHNPYRELYVLHTSREKPDIIEKQWVGVRGS